MRSRSPQTTPVAIAAVCLVAVPVLTYARLFFGIDFTDESFYTAVPYRFVTGARPLVDETNLVQQTPGILLYPFIRAYVELFGLDGIVLYARHLHFIFSGAIAAAMFTGLRATLSDNWLSAVIASTAVAFVPFGIHGLSYNSFGSGFLAAGLFLGLAWLSNGHGRFLVASGATLGLAVFVYPPLVIPVTCCFTALYLVSRPRSLRVLGSGLLASGVCVLVTILFFMQDGLATAPDLVSQTQTFGGQGGGLSKVVDVGFSVSGTFTEKSVAFVVLVILFAVYRWKKQYVFIPLLALPVLALPLGQFDEPLSNVFITNFALFGPIVFLLVRDDPIAQRLLAAVWFPSAVAGVVTAYSSANGGLNTGIGLFPASVATAVLIAIAIRRTENLFRDILMFLPVATFVLLCLALQYLSVYRDAPVRSLDSRVRGGAYAGLFTTTQKHVFLKTLEADLKSVSGPKCRVLFYDTFPGGYLLDGGTSLTNATWLLKVPPHQRSEYQRLLITYFGRETKVPDVAVRLNRVPLGNNDAIEQSYSESAPLERMFRPPAYAVVRDRAAYRIVRRVAARCASGAG